MCCQPPAVNSEGLTVLEVGLSSVILKLASATYEKEKLGLIFARSSPVGTPSETSLRCEDSMPRRLPALQRNSKLPRGNPAFCLAITLGVNHNVGLWWTAWKVDLRIFRWRGNLAGGTPGNNDPQLPRDNFTSSRVSPAHHPTMATNRASRSSEATATNPIQ